MAVEVQVGTGQEVVRLRSGENAPYEGVLSPFYRYRQYQVAEMEVDILNDKLKEIKECTYTDGTAYATIVIVVAVGVLGGWLLRDSQRGHSNPFSQLNPSIFHF